MKTILATVGAAMTAVTLGAAEADSEKSELDEEETKTLEAGIDFDFQSAYIDKNTVVNDRMVMQPCVWADWTILDPLYIGFSIWQNWDVTGRRRGEEGDFKHALNETDYNIHAGAALWQSEDGESDLTLEIGHDWFTYQGRRGSHDDYPDTREIYAKLTYANPIVDIYGRTSWMYHDFGNYDSGCRKGVYYELGLNKEIEIIENLTLGADWSVGFGDSRFLSYLYGDRYQYDGEGEEVGSSHPKGGVGGTTIKAYLSYAVTEWFSIGGTIGYTGVLNGDARDGLEESGEHCDFRDCLWGGINAKFSF